MLDEALLPIVQALQGRRCSLNVQLGAYAEDLDVDVIDGHEDRKSVDISELRQKLMNVVVTRSLGWADDQIVLSQAKLEPR